MSSALSSISSSSSSHLSPSNKRKEVTVVVETPYFDPYFKGEGDKVTGGSEFRLLNSFAQKNGINILYLHRPFNEMFSALDSGEAQVLAGGFGKTPERIEKYNYVESVFSRYGAYTTNFKSAFISSKEDLSKPNVRFVLVENTASFDYIKEKVEMNRIVGVSTTDQLDAKVLELGQKESSLVPIAVDDENYINSFVHTHSEKFFTINPDYLPDNEGSQNVIYFNKNSHPALANFDKDIEEYKRQQSSNQA